MAMRTTLVTLVGVVAFALPASSASAATCADYSNQAAAQRAADTRDANSNGVYCESLPCPCLKGGSSSPPPPPPPPTRRCGIERWSVKTLTDNGASRVNFTPTAATVDQLRARPAPDVGRNSPRLTGEFSAYRLEVRLRSMKIENDSDIHLVIADPSNAQHTMVVEFPKAGCVRKAGATARRRMARARAALTHACGAAGTGSFRLLTGTATITGVAFFDVIHGQRGVAPNGIELHPVLSFTATSKCARR